MSQLYDSPVFNESLLARVVSVGGSPGSGYASNPVARSRMAQLKAAAQLSGSSDTSVRFDAVRLDLALLLVLFCTVFYLSWFYISGLPSGYQVGLPLVLLFLSYWVAGLTFHHPHAAPYLAPVFVCLEAAFLASLPHFWLFGQMELFFNLFGISFCVLLSTLLLNQRARRVGQSRTVLFVATMVVATIFWYMYVPMVGYLFHVPMVLPHNLGPTYFLLAQSAIFFAADAFIDDLEYTSLGNKHKAPRYIEWYAAFSLMFTFPCFYVFSFTKAIMESD